MPTGGGKVAFYTNATGMVRVGTDIEFNASVSAPRGELHVYSRTTLNGGTSAKRLQYEPDVVQVASGMPSGSPGDQPPPAPTCDDGLRNGSATGVDCGGSCPNACPTCNAGTHQAETMFHSTGGSAPDGWNNWSNGFISAQHMFSGGASRITLRARGSVAQNIWPRMTVSVGGSVVGQVFVASTSFQPYTFNFTTSAGTKELRVTFDNDLHAPPEDRNLYVDSVEVSCPPPSAELSVTLPVTSDGARATASMSR